MALDNYSRIFKTQFVPVCTSRHKKSSTFNSLTTLYKGENDVVLRRGEELQEEKGPEASFRSRRLHHSSAHTLFMSFTVTVVKLNGVTRKKG